MSTAKEKYYQAKEIVDKHFGGQIDDINNYVEELEQENGELIDRIIDTQKFCCRYCNGHQTTDCRNHCYPFLLNRNIIEKHTGKPIEEILENE